MRCNHRRPFGRLRADGVRLRNGWLPDGDDGLLLYDGPQGIKQGGRGGLLLLLLLLLPLHHHHHHLHLPGVLLYHGQAAARGLRRLLLLLLHQLRLHRHHHPLLLLKHLRLLDHHGADLLLRPRIAEAIHTAAAAAAADAQQ